MVRSLLITSTLAVMIVLMASPALACLWDHDTLRAEAKGLPGLAQIITGRFERNPPLYYQMRLERSEKDIAANPQDWEAYDNAGVACDRLGRHDEAIDWMDRKKTAMAATGDDDALPDHRYRYLANLGTFYAHRWFGNGARRDDMADMQRGIALIEDAIELNPNAHFGRERYQLMAMRWILNPPEADMHQDRMSELPNLFMADGPYRKLLAERGERSAGNLRDAGLHDAVEGLSGLIVMGNAWESVDVFFALALALNDELDSAMAHLAKLRCIELIRSGKKSMHPSVPMGEELVDLIVLRGYESTEEADIDAFFPKARAAADAWHNNRLTFMMARLEAGRHPDTDASFWDGYTEEASIALPNGFLGLGRERVSTVVYVAVAITAALLIGFGVIWLIRRLRRTRAVGAVSGLH